MDTDDDFWGIETAIASKQTPFAVGSWIGMVSGVEGRDKFLKIVQFYAKYMKYQRESDSKEAAAAWGGLMTSVQEGRKSVRWLKGINKIDQVFTEVPKAASLLEKIGILGNWLGLAFHWHFDYLAHAHRMKFVKFDDATYQRIFNTPSWCWTTGNVCQFLLGLATLSEAKKGIDAARDELDNLGKTTSESADDPRPPPASDLRAAMEARIKALRLKRFKGWLLLVKALADFITSANMAGVNIRKRLPGLFGWCNDGVVGASGVLSALIVCFNLFPAKKDGTDAGLGWQPMQSERNAAAAVFTFMQMRTLMANSPAVNA